jgi:thiamine biosynthesis lipoprotein
MHRRSRIATTMVVVTVALTAGGVPAADELRRFTRTEVHMATGFTLVAYAPDAAVAETAFDAAFARIAAIDARLNDYNPDSELSRLSARAPTAEAVPVSDDVWAVLVRADSFARLTDGAFDATVGPLTTLWRQMRVRRRLAAPEAVAAAVAAAGYRHMRLDEASRGVALLQPGMRLDLGGIGQGFAADEALAVLRSHGLTSALVDASGDIACGLPPPGVPAWRIGIASSKGEEGAARHLHVSSCGVSTSGDAFQSVEIDGVRYSHIVDPRTGLGLTRQASATVIARDCTTADSYATAVSVLGPQKGLELIEETKDAAAVIVRAPEGKVETFTSKRLAEHIEPSTADEM